MSLSPGRFLIYDAQSLASNADGSKRMQVVWDSQDWGLEHAFTHPKFNRPIIWKGASIGRAMTGASMSTD